VNISGDNPESGYTLLGFYMPGMPHWLELSPTICHTMETLLCKRPVYANRYTANAVDTPTHEMIHASASPRQRRRRHGRGAVRPAQPFVPRRPLPRGKAAADAE